MHVSIAEAAIVLFLLVLVLVIEIEIMLACSSPIGYPQALHVNLICQGTVLNY